ncbi:MAG TPA: CAP domain-containing protein [Patescibacteria group bacterium]|nr:CAP domain-containing protein [Patescibacteria group bacterium]
MIRFLKHLLFPHHKNNHRSKILHNSSLLIIFLALSVTVWFTHSITSSHPQVLGISYSISENDLLNLVNQQRQDNGLPPLKINSELDAAASKKAADMFAKDYWAHFAPDGKTTPWQFIKDSGYDYVFAGENLAKGFTDANSIVTAWMNSPTHRDNILSDRYRDIGFAIVPGTLQGEDTVLVVQMFGSTVDTTVQKLPDQAASAPNVSVAPQVHIASAPQVNGSSVPNGKVIESRPLIDSKSASKATTTVVLSLICFALIMDLLIIERKKIPRIVGHNIDHIILIALFMLFMVLKTSGVIV